MKLTDEDLAALESAIADAPDNPPVRGTGGLRKIRFAPHSSSGGKSGGARACYVHFADHGLVYLCAVFAKNDKVNLTAAEREAYRKLLESFRRYLREHRSEGRTP